MDNTIVFKDYNPRWLEKFGLYYLSMLNRKDLTHDVFDLTDEVLTQRIKKITGKGIIFSSVIGILCVFPTVWVDVYFTNSSLWEHYGWVAAVTIVSVIIELYVLFIIALKAVYEVSELINLHATKNELMEDGPFSVKHILARTALELPDPELKILAIDPFKRVSKKNLFVLGLLYKVKIFITNLILKFGLKYTVGNTLLGIPILYEALPVECFWNIVVIKRVVMEARLRLFGFALANQIAKDVINDKLLQQLSPLAKTGCLRAIGNAVVMAQNYHPNMIILLLRFQEILQITEENKYDDWEMFLETLKKVNAKERYFLLDLLTVSAAFDGRLSDLEDDNLRAAYESDYDQYYPRLVQLSQNLKDGQLNAALALCKLDFVAG